MKDVFKLKNVIILAWIIFLSFCVGFAFSYPEFFRPKAIADFLVQFKNTLLFVYLGISILRGLTLVPNTPFVLAGTILFPSEPFLVLAISITGIIFSSTMIYYFSDYLGFGTYLERKYPEKIVKIQDRLQKPSGLLFVFLWALMPFLPTDVVCYVAGTLKMNFLKFISSMAFGELIICSIYIFFYSAIVKFLPAFG